MNIYLERAKFVFEQIKKFKEENPGENEQGKLKSYAKTVPGHIKMNGFLQTVALLDVKRKGKNEEEKKGKNEEEKKGYACLYGMIVQWLVRRKMVSNEKTELQEIPLNKNNQNLKEALASMRVGQYKLAEKETLELFSWIRRFAEGELKGDAE